MTTRADVGPLPPGMDEQVIALWEAAGLTRPWNDPHADLRRALDGPSSTVLAQVEDGRLLATAMVGHDGHRGWLYYVAVAPVARRRGLGTAVVRAAEAWVTGCGIPKMQLTVRTENAATAQFYAALGYADVDALLLGRRLDGG